MKKFDQKNYPAVKAGVSPYRRRLIKMGAAVASLPLIHGCGNNGEQSEGAHALVNAQTNAVTRVTSFDSDWLFHLGTLDSENASVASFADQSWRLLDLPHDWSIEDAPGVNGDGAATSQPSHLFFFEQPTLTDTAPSRIGPFDKTATPGDRATGRTLGGEGWYRKHFTITPTPGKQVELRFDGVYQNADTWINGHYLGFHPYGYTAFSYDLTPYLVMGNNVIAVRVRNLGKNSRWYSGSGIYRHTQLAVTGAVRSPRFGVGLITETLSAGAAFVSANVTVQNTSSGSVTPTVRVILFDPSGNQVASATGAVQTIAGNTLVDTVVKLSVPTPQVWSPDTPVLYTAVTQIILIGATVDQTLETFGIRTAAVNGTDGFILNGNPLKLRGGNVHHTNGALGAISIGDEEMWRMSILKKAGYNAIRIAHNPPSREFLEAADRLGLILVNEFVDMWDAGKNDDDYHLYFAEWWERDMESWVRASRNSPATCIWSIANEIYDSAAATPRGLELMAKMRTLDTSRPVMQGGAQGMLFIYNGPTVAPYTDFGDVHYEPSFTVARQKVPGKAWMQSESFASSFYDHWKLVTDNNFVMGDFVWTAWDYIGEAGLGVPKLVNKENGGEETIYIGDFADFGAQAGGTWAPYPWFAAGCGDFDLIGQMTAQHLYRRAVLDISTIEIAVARPVSGNRRQQAFAFGWFDELESWTWDVPTATAMRVHVYTSADRVDLYLNEQLVETINLVDSNKRIASFWVSYHPGMLRAVAFKNGIQIGVKDLITAGVPAALKLTADTVNLTTSRDAIAHVLASIVDNQGNLVPDAVVRISFTTNGGELAAVGSGNPHNVDSFKQGKRYSYHGKAMAYVRPPKIPGRVILQATADGLRPASLTLTVS